MEGIEFVFCAGAALNSSVSEHLGVPALEGRDDPAYFVKRDVHAFGLEWDATYVSLFFAENPGYRTACGTVGRHAGDVERIVILRDYVTGRPALVYFGAHGRGQGVWVDWEACDVRHGYLRVYVAAGSNGMYPRPGRYWRMFGFANDVCGGDGAVKTYKCSELTDASAMSWTMVNYQVAPGVNSPFNAVDPSEGSITAAQRAFLPLCTVCVQRRPTIQRLPPV